MLFFSDVSGIRPKARLPNLSFPNGNLCNQKQNPQNFLLKLLLSHLMKLKPWAVGLGRAKTRPEIWPVGHGF